MGGSVDQLSRAAGFDICGSAKVTLGGAMAAPPQKWKSRGSKRTVAGIY